MASVRLCRMRLLWAAAVLCVSSLASAQQRQPVFTLRAVRNAAAESARAKAAAGDCKGALDQFDEALRHSEDPTLYRDRGKCHDKLGDVYPALEDYRSYIARAPNAPDADDIREKINTLIAQSSQDMAPGLGGGGTYETEMQGGIKDGSTPVVVKNASTVPPATKEEEPAGVEQEPKSVSDMEYKESRERETSKSAMRKGTGFVVGAYYYPRYVFADKFDFESGQGIGARIGWSFAASSTLFLEIGYMDQLSSGTETAKDGFDSLLGYEARIPFDQWATNQLVLGVGGGYENLNYALIGQTYGCIQARGRVGYRHVFGASFALDFDADGGFLAAIPLNGGTSTAVGLGAFFGGIVALSVGF